MPHQPGEVSPGFISEVGRCWRATFRVAPACRSSSDRPRLCRNWWSISNRPKFHRRARSTCRAPRSSRLHSYDHKASICPSPTGPRSRYPWCPQRPREWGMVGGGSSVDARRQGAGITRRNLAPPSPPHPVERLRRSRRASSSIPPSVHTDEDAHRWFEEVALSERRALQPPGQGLPVNGYRRSGAGIGRLRPDWKQIQGLGWHGRWFKDGSRKSRLGQRNLGPSLGHHVAEARAHKLHPGWMPGTDRGVSDLLNRSVWSASARLRPVLEGSLQNGDRPDCRVPKVVGRRAASERTESPDRYRRWWQAAHRRSI